MPGCEQCQQLERIKKLEIDAESNRVTHKEFFARFEDAKVKQALAEERWSQVLIKLDELKSQINEIAQQPAKKWNSLTLSAITGIVTCVVGIVVGRSF